MSLTKEGSGQKGLSLYKPETKLFNLLRIG